MTLTRLIHLRMSDDLYRELEAAAEQDEQTVAGAARLILKRHFQQNDQRQLVDSRIQYTTENASRV